jgi:hypothetical protein
MSKEQADPFRDRPGGRAIQLLVYIGSRERLSGSSESQGPCIARVADPR